MRFSAALLTAVILCAILCADCLAQKAVGVPSLPAVKVREKPGSVSVTVTASDTGQPVADTDIQLVMVGSPHKRMEARTDFQGKFKFDAVEAGRWQVLVSKHEMFSHKQEFDVESEKESVLNIKLRSAEEVDVIKVQKERDLVHAQDPPVTTHIDPVYVEELGSGNNLQRLVDSAPGVMPDSNGNVVARGDEVALTYQIDGVQLPEAAGILGQQSQLVSPRSLRSLDVVTGAFEARDGAAPLGAIVKMRTLPISDKPTLQIGTQLGGPISGGLNYYASGAMSGDPNSKWNRLRVESSGNIFGSKFGLAPPAHRFRRDGRFDLNSLTKIVYDASENDRFSLTTSFNETYLHQPTNVASRNAGFKLNEHDRQNYIIFSYRRLMEKFFDEANLHIVNAFYSQRVYSNGVFDPSPYITGDGEVIRAAMYNARRFNYALSFQGDISKTFKTHALTAGFLSELRPVRTRFDELVFNADPRFAEEVPIGQLVSPFTGLPGGPQFLGIGKLNGFRWVQGMYLQDKWTPQGKFLNRFTFNTGVRCDIYRGTFGASPGVYQTVAAIPGIGPFSPEPFVKHTVNNVGVSGRYAASFALTKKTILRASYQDLFVPPPTDIFLQPFDVSEGPDFVRGVFNGSPRPMQAMRGHMVDAGISQQIGSRFAVRNTLFSKLLYNSSDTDVLNNTAIYSRVTFPKTETLGIETRFDLKTKPDGFGFYGFLSNTIAVVRSLGNKLDSGGIWDVGELVTEKYPDHDRRQSLQVALGFRSRRGFWVLGDVQFTTGLKDSRNFAIFGPHPARVRPMTLLGLNFGYQLPTAAHGKRPYLPSAIEVRIQNLTNNVGPINYGSPYQGIRFSLPIRVLAGLTWRV